MVKWYDFPPVAKFTDCRGQIRNIRALPGIRLIQFKELLNDIHSGLEQCEGDRSWQEIYTTDKYIQHLIDSALLMCEVKPQWVSLPLIHFLLFARWDDDLQVNLPGLLIEVNTPATVASSGHELKTPDTIALLALAADNLHDAFELYGNVPAELLNDVLVAKSRMTERMEKGSQPISDTELHEPIDKAELTRLINTLGQSNGS